MSPEEGNGGEEESRGTRRLRYRIAFFLTALVALSVLVTLPFSVKSVVDDILGPVEVAQFGQRDCQQGPLISLG